MALSKKQIEYELGIHDCGQNAYCNSYRGCSDASEPIPSFEELEELKSHYRERCIEMINNSQLNVDVDSTIQRWMREHWHIYYNIKL